MVVDRLALDGPSSFLSAVKIVRHKINPSRVSFPKTQSLPRDD